MESHDLLGRFWEDLLARPSGPLAFRFVLQPLMAAFFGVRDGIKDARSGRSPYFWRAMTHPDERMAMLKEGIRATSKILILAVVLDTIYQFKELSSYRPLEAIVTAVVLGLIPYIAIRGPVDRIVRRYEQRRNKSAGGR